MARRPYDKKRPDVALAISLGWTFCGLSGGGHLQFSHPKVIAKMTIPNSPSDHRSVKNGMSWIRRNTPRED
jgi:predicted RNA binding protein YcfA (HicA-like mRNA interferase family)